MPGSNIDGQIDGQIDAQIFTQISAQKYEGCSISSGTLGLGVDLAHNCALYLVSFESGKCLLCFECKFEAFTHFVLK